MKKTSKQRFHAEKVIMGSMLWIAFQSTNWSVAQSSNPDVQVAIQSAIEELDSPSFSARERATRELWGFGVQVESVLRGLTESGNLEARQRATQILADFDFGITPDAPPHIAKLLRQYRSGTTEIRRQIFSILIAGGEFEPVQALLRRTTDRRTRHAVYAQSIESTPLMIGMIQHHELDAWIEVMAQDDFQQPRHEIVSNWLTNKNVLKTLVQQDKLKIVDQAIAQESSDDNRNRLLRRLFVQRAFTDFFSSPQYLQRMLNYIDLLPDQTQRHELFVRFLSLTRDPTVYDQPSIGKLERFARERGTAKTIDEFWSYLLETILLRQEIASQMTLERLRGFASQLDASNLARLRRSLKENSPNLISLLDE